MRAAAAVGPFWPHLSTWYINRAEQFPISSIHLSYWLRRQMLEKTFGMAIRFLASEQALQTYALLRRSLLGGILSCRGNAHDREGTSYRSLSMLISLMRFFFQTPQQRYRAHWHKRSSIERRGYIMEITQLGYMMEITYDGYLTIKSTRWNLHGRDGNLQDQHQNLPSQQFHQGFQFLRRCSELLSTTSRMTCHMPFKLSCGSHPRISHEDLPQLPSITCSSELAS